MTQFCIVEKLCIMVNEKIKTPQLDLDIHCKIIFDKDVKVI